MKIVQDKYILLPISRSTDKEQNIIKSIVSKYGISSGQLSVINKPVKTQGDFSIVAHTDKEIFKLIAGKKSTKLFSTYENLKTANLITDYKIYHSKLNSLGVKVPKNLNIIPIPAKLIGSNKNNPDYILMEIHEYVDSEDMYHYLLNNKNDSKIFIETFNTALEIVLKVLPEIGSTIGFDPVPSNFLINGYFIDFYPAFNIPGTEHSELKVDSFNDNYIKAKLKMLFEPIPLIYNFVINFAVLSPDNLNEIICATLESLSTKLRRDYINYQNDKDFAEMINYINARIQKRYSDETIGIPLKQILTH